jgi:putative heme-binding domain-containing protein
MDGRAQDQPPKSGFFLPKNPVAAAYVLGRLTNQELIAAPRSEFVYVALLQRKGLDRKYYLEALAGLAKLRQSDPLTELLRGLAELDKKDQDSVETLRDLSPVLLQTAPAELNAHRAGLEQLIAQSGLPLTRQIAYAALVTADGTIEPSWKQAESKANHLLDLIQGIPLIREPALRAAFQPKLEPLVRDATSPEIRRAAITSLAALPGHEGETFKMLANLVRAGDERPTAIASLARLPQKYWPRELLPPLATSLLQYLQQVPTGERTQPAFTTALQFANDVATLLPADQARSLAQSLRGLGPAVIVLRPVYEQLRFDKQLLVVEAGKPVVVILENEDAMPHNLAIVAPGALEEIGLAAEKMPAEPDSQGRLYVPASPKVLHASKLVMPGQKAQLAFTASGDPGEYPYVCTFPGHWRRMSGTLMVVKDLEAYLASHAESQQPKFTEWKLQDLTPELAKVGWGRNLENGKELFTKLACVQCHKLGSQGYAYGPDLTDVYTRYKNDRAEVLQQILEPSKKIDDRYRNFEFELRGAEPVTGMVMKEDADAVVIQTGPADSLIQNLKKADILKRSSQNSSPMPLGLLNALSKDQIFDLLAYLESKGDLQAHVHAH